MIKQNTLFKKYNFIFQTIFILWFLNIQNGIAQEIAPKLFSNTNVASAGFYRLHWETAIKQVELQEADNSAFNSPTVFYEGSDSATVISGKPNGTWYYRIRTIENQLRSDWSDPVVVTVSHHSLSRALLFFLVGLIMFITTVLLVVKGTKNIK